MSRFPPHQETILVPAAGRETSGRISEFLLPRRHPVALHRALRRARVRKEHVLLAVGVQQSAQLCLQLAPGTARGPRDRPPLGSRNQTRALRWQRGWQCLLRAQNPVHCKTANENT